MEDKIKKYFDNLEVPYNSEHWNLMEQRMAIEELSEFTNKEDEAFDDYVKKELVFEEPAFNPMHWDLMAEKLEERSWRGVLYRYKITEVGLMLLLLFTIWFTILPHDEAPQFASLDTAVTNQTDNLVTGHNIKINTVHHNRLMASSKRVSVNNSITNLLSQKNTEVVSTERRGLDGLGIFNSPHVLNSSKLRDRSILTANSRSIQTTVLNSQVLNIEKHIQYIKPLGNVRIGVYAASGIEKVSLEENSNINSEPNLAFGYGGGVSLGLKFKDMEFETGASYNTLVPLHISDDAIANKSTNKNATAKADEPANKYLKLPFALKYLFDNEGSWKFYALGGGNVHIDVNSHDWQQRSSSYTLDARTTSPDASLSSNQINQGATFFDRFYYTASIGFGVEKQISDRVCLFIQPEYYHQLYKPTINLGAGQTNTFALSFGLKSIL